MMTPITYSHDGNGNIYLPEGPPFDGNPVLIKTNTGIVEAWWCRAKHHPLLKDPDNMEGFCWVCYDDKFQLELDDAKFWMPLPNDNKGAEEPSEKMIDAGYNARIPGGSNAYNWMIPHEGNPKATQNIRDVISRIYKAMDTINES